MACQVLHLACIFTLHGTFVHHMENSLQHLRPYLKQWWPGVVCWSDRNLLLILYAVLEVCPRLCCAHLLGTHAPLCTTGGDNAARPMDRLDWGCCWCPASCMPTSCSSAGAIASSACSPWVTPQVSTARSQWLHHKQQSGRGLGQGMGRGRCPLARQRFLG